MKKKILNASNSWFKLKVVVFFFFSRLFRFYFEFLSEKKYENLIKERRKKKDRRKEGISFLSKHI